LADESLSAAGYYGLFLYFQNNGFDYSLTQLAENVISYIFYDVNTSSSYPANAFYEGNVDQSSDTETIIGTANGNNTISFANLQPMTVVPPDSSSNAYPCGFPADPIVTIPVSVYVNLATHTAQEIIYSLL
jgi:hypothetical protein